LAFVLFRKLTKNITAAALAANAVVLAPIVNNFGISWGYSYNQTAGLMLLIAGLCFLPLKLPEQTKKNYLLFFSFMVLLLYTTNHFAHLFPALGVLCFYPLVRQYTLSSITTKAGLRKVWLPFTGRLLLYAAVSFVTVTLVLCAVHKIFYGEWLFFAPVLKSLGSVMYNAGEYKLGVYNVVFFPMDKSPGLFTLLFTGMFVSVFVLVRCIITRKVSLSAFLSFCYMMTFLWTGAGYYVLRLSYFVFLSSIPALYFFRAAVAAVPVFQGGSGSGNFTKGRLFAGAVLRRRDAVPPAVQYKGGAV
jgi:hypothetical protein